MATTTYTTINGLLVHEDRGGTESFYIPDTLGNLMTVRSSTGTKTYGAEYWPYGEIQTETGTNPSPWSFVGLLGYLKDTASRLYVRARNYRPGLARWQTVDPLWLELPRFVAQTIAGFQMPFGSSSDLYRYVSKVTRYTYARNCPSQLTDPTGKQPGNNPGEGYPNFGRGLGGFPNYGNYCGADTRCDESQPAPLDCIDAACQEHDNCLKFQTDREGVSWGWWDEDALRCHCKLALSAWKCNSLFGCKPWEVSCNINAAFIKAFFSISCLTIIGGQLGPESP